ncbi:hypothetical protein HRbin40_02234 [bacterium HR40]|nr:hypothetical protein HRbin40_02234 [bacterium HR40]
MIARIYRPAKPAGSSGRAKSRQWILEFEPQAARLPDRLVGWSGSTDTPQQLRLRFASREEAIDYCRRHGIPFELAEPHDPAFRPRAYAENFVRRP